MQPEELIIRTSFQSAALTGAGFKVLVAAIANGFLQQTNRVQISTRDWAEQTGLTRESVRKVLTDELGPHLPVENLGKNANGRCGFILLPLGWISTQTRLSFMEDEAYPSLWIFPRKTANRPKNLATPPAKKVGQYRPGNWAGTHAESDDTGQKTWPVPTPKAMIPAQKLGQSGQETRPVPTETDVLYARARIESNRIESELVSSEVLHRIEVAVETVEIPADRQESAQLVSDLIERYRRIFPDVVPTNPKPDLIVLAQILALAPMDQIEFAFDRLFQRRPMSEPPAQDGWFLSTLANQIYRVPRSTVKKIRDRIKSQKQKPFHQDGTPPLDGIDWSPNVLEFAKQKTRMPA